MNRTDLRTGMQQRIAWIDDAGNCYFPEALDDYDEFHDDSNYEYETDNGNIVMEQQGSNDIKLQLDIEINGSDVFNLKESSGESNALATHIRVYQNPAKGDCDAKVDGNCVKFNVQVLENFGKSKWMVENLLRKVDGVRGCLDSYAIKELFLRGVGSSAGANIVDIYHGSGDEVDVHHTRTLLDETKFDSRRDGSTPFKFTLDQGQVIKEWDPGIKKGENSIFTIPPTILPPPNATLQFDVELLSWFSVKDICKDGGIFIQIIATGDKAKNPKDLDEVFVRYEAKLEFYEQGNLDMAILHYKRVMACDVGFLGATNNVGNAIDDVGMEFILAPLLSDEVCEAFFLTCLDMFNESSNDDFDAILAKLEKGLSMADTMKELGYGCTINISQCKGTFYLYQPLIEVTVARILGTVTHTCTGLEDNQNVFSMFRAIPRALAEETKKIASLYSDVLSATILDIEQCKALTMGTYLGVVAASANPPHFIHLCYRPLIGQVKTKLALVVKGLTFDSGGNNIKTGLRCSIEIMKFDMGGSATVLGAAKDIGQIKPTGVEVCFEVAACENMISATWLDEDGFLTNYNDLNLEDKVLSNGGGKVMNPIVVDCSNYVNGPTQTTEPNSVDQPSSAAKKSTRVRSNGWTTWLVS